MRLFALEFFKTRRRWVWATVAALLLCQLCWVGWSFTYMEEDDIAQGWMFCLYQFPMLNAVMMPVIAALLATRLCDMEHKGQTLKLLETLAPPGRLFDTKFLCGAAYLAGAVLAQVLLMVAAGSAKGFYGAPPLGALLTYFFTNLLLDLGLYLIQLILSLLIFNQLAPLVVGIAGAFMGLF